MSLHSLKTDLIRIFYQQYKVIGPEKMKFFISKKVLKVDRSFHLFYQLGPGLSSKHFLLPWLRSYILSEIISLVWDSGKKGGLPLFIFFRSYIDCNVLEKK